ncbi:MAG: hypothetical protein AAF688_10350 [Bacteroidota bacterium]
MKIFNIIVTVVALGIIIFNVTKLDFSNLLDGESQIALISILAAGCAIFLVQILRLSKKVALKAK